MTQPATEQTDALWTQPAPEPAAVQAAQPVQEPQSSAWAQTPQQSPAQVYPNASAEPPEQPVAQTFAAEGAYEEQPAAAPAAVQNSAVIPRSPVVKNEHQISLLALIVIVTITTLSVLTLLFALLSGSGGKMPPEVFGNYLFPMTTSALQREIPQGALIVTQISNPRELLQGDNVTYIGMNGAYITDKIRVIHEDYNNSGQRGFEIGMPSSADPDVIFGLAIIGRVMLVIPHVGTVVSLAADNIHIPIVLIVLCVFAFLYFSGMLSGIPGLAPKNKAVKENKAKTNPEKKSFLPKSKANTDSPKKSFLPKKAPGAKSINIPFLSKSAPGAKSAKNPITPGAKPAKGGKDADIWG